jgi:hypothetical protein
MRESISARFSRDLLDRELGVLIASARLTANKTTSYDITTTVRSIGDCNLWAGRFRRNLGWQYDVQIGID